VERRAKETKKKKNLSPGVVLTSTSPSPPPRGVPPPGGAKKASGKIPLWVPLKGFIKSGILSGVNSAFLAQTHCPYIFPFSLFKFRRL